MMKWLTEFKLFLRGLPEKNKLLLLSLVVGISSGLAAVLLETLVRAIHRGLTSWFDSAGDNFLYLVYPGVGMLLSLLILRLVIKDNIGHGVTKVLVAVSKNESRIRPHNMWSSILTSSLTIGFGGSVGAEAPIVYTGAAIGSNFARYMGMSYRKHYHIAGMRCGRCSGRNFQGAACRCALHIGNPPFQYIHDVNDAAAAFYGLGHDGVIYISWRQPSVRVHIDPV